MEVKNQDHKYFEVYQDIWNFHKEHHQMMLSSDNDTFWQSAVNKSAEITEKYNNDDFVADLLESVINELEKIKQTIKEGQ